MRKAYEELNVLERAAGIEPSPVPAMWGVFVAPPMPPTLLNKLGVEVIVPRPATRTVTLRAPGGALYSSAICWEPMRRHGRTRLGAEPITLEAPNPSGVFETDVSPFISP